MKIIVALVAIFLFSSSTFAQTMEDRLKVLEEVLKKQEKTIQELKTLQKTVKKQEQTIEDQRKLIEGLKAEVQQPQPAAAASNRTEAPRQVRQQVKELKEKVDQVAEAQRKVLPSEFNPAIGLVGETIFGYRSGKSSETGSDRPGGYDVNQRSVELNVTASVDPFAKAYAVINASADPVTGEAALGVEEAALQTDSLPWNMTLKAGRFFGEFGRLSYIHDHEFPLVNRPLALDQIHRRRIEDRRGAAQLPAAVRPHYVSLTAGLGDPVRRRQPSQQSRRFPQLQRLNFWSRLSTYFDLTPESRSNRRFRPLEPAHAVSRRRRQSAVPAAAGNTYTERERRLYGADMC